MNGDLTLILRSDLWLDLTYIEIAQEFSSSERKGHSKLFPSPVPIPLSPENNRHHFQRARGWGCPGSPSAPRRSFLPMQGRYEVWRYSYCQFCMLPNHTELELVIWFGPTNHPPHCGEWAVNSPDSGPSHSCGFEATIQLSHSSNLEPWSRAMPVTPLT